MTVFMNILTVSGFMVGVLCFFGYDQKFRGWNRQRNISRLEKQRKYYVELAGSEAAIASSIPIYLSSWACFSSTSCF